MSDIPEEGGADGAGTGAGAGAEGGATAMPPPASPSPPPPIVSEGQAIPEEREKLDERRGRNTGVQFEEIRGPWDTGANQKQRK